MHPLVEQLTVGETLPEVAINACLADIDSVAPDLLRLAEKAADGTLEPLEDDPCFFGLHILGAARDRRLCAPLLRLLRRPEEELEAFLGDTDTITLPRIVIGCFDGNADELFALIRNPAVGEYIRDGLFRAVAFLTWEGRIDPAATRAFIEQYDEQRCLPDTDFAWLAWSRVIELLGWSDLTPRAERAYADGRIPPEISTFDLFQGGLAETAAAAPDDAGRFDAERLGYFENLVRDLSDFTWSDTRQPADDRPVRPGSLDTASWGMPERNPMRHVGRNDPCPCGSGKKYKRCCGAAA